MADELAGIHAVGCVPRPFKAGIVPSAARTIAYQPP
jgi:hypothetical protein